jgi:alkylhydroperoxidase/carboxymuconolactone decarboxylase family protein YurZ
MVRPRSPARPSRRFRPVERKRERTGVTPDRDGDWSFPFEAPLHDVFPALHEAQSSWLSQIDSLRAPDRKTHELIRLACTVILRNPPGVERHARFAREVGASWDEVLGSIMLTCPGFGMLPAVEAIPHARRGFDAAEEPEEDDGE